MDHLSLKKTQQLKLGAFWDGALLLGSFDKETQIWANTWSPRAWQRNQYVKHCIVSASYLQSLECYTAKESERFQQASAAAVVFTD